MLAAISLDFDPSASVFGLSIRLETLALAGIVLLVLLLAALRSSKSRFVFGVLVVGSATVAAGSFFDVPMLQTVAACVAIPPFVYLLMTLSAGRLPADLFKWKGAEDEPSRLRRDDLILIAFGAIPGAVVGARLSYVLIHLDYYRADTNAITDPAQGGFGLTLAVVLGTLTAVAVARLLAAPIGRWLGAASVPLLLGLGLGKLAMVLGGSGQGNYSDASWATGYVGAGPWGSANPSFPAVPSQVMEGGLVLAAVVPLLILPFVLRFRIRRWKFLLRPGFSPWRDSSLLSGSRRFLLVIGLWAMARFAAEFTWRDAQVRNGLGADQLVLLPVAALAALGILVPLVVGLLYRALVGGFRLVRGRVAKAALATADPTEVLAEPKGLPPDRIEAPAEVPSLPPSRTEVPAEVASSTPNRTEVPAEPSGLVPYRTEAPAEVASSTPNRTEVPAEPSDLSPHPAEVPAEASSLPPDPSDLPGSNA